MLEIYLIFCSKFVQTLSQGKCDFKEEPNCKTALSSDRSVSIGILISIEKCLLLVCDNIIDILFVEEMADIKENIESVHPSVVVDED